MSFIEIDETAQSPVAHTLWVEKYRPIGLDQYVGNDTLKAKIKQYIANNDIPHLLFYGSAGTGKTTLAKLIASSIKCDVMYINASDENGIETVRVKIKNFASTIGFNNLKIIILDEADYFTPAGQAGLRNTMETFSEHTRFILTANHHERIVDPIISRCQLFSITPPSKNEVAMTLLRILTAENVKFEKKDIALIVQSHYPDIRAVINTAQRNVISGELKVATEDVAQGDLKTKLLAHLMNKDTKRAFTDIRQLMANNSIKSYSDFYTYMYEQVEVYAPENVVEVVVILADSQFQDAQVVDKEICFAACISKVLNSTK
jgi:DNA polymerase III delta prime subunit